MKNSQFLSNKLVRIRLLFTWVVIIGLSFPFILQQSFYPFFRFGMFAEPVTREIQSETFEVMAVDTDGYHFSSIGLKTGIDQSKLNYLLRNHYYRQEINSFAKQYYQLLAAGSGLDTILIVRNLNQESTIIARYPAW